MSTIQYLRTRDITSELLNIIREARIRITLISPYLYIDEDYKRELRQADAQGVKTRLVFRPQDPSRNDTRYEITSGMHPEAKAFLSELRNVEVYQHHGMHAKCYFNENKMIQTSMNFYKSSHSNEEMGSLVIKEKDLQYYTTVTDDVERMIRASTRVNLTPEPRQPTSPGRNANANRAEPATPPDPLANELEDCKRMIRMQGDQLKQMQQKMQQMEQERMQFMQQQFQMPHQQYQYQPIKQEVATQATRRPPNESPKRPAPNGSDDIVFDNNEFKPTIPVPVSPLRQHGDGSNNSTQSGSCITCGKPIPYSLAFNGNMPFCDSCVHNTPPNHNVTAKFCHRCGLADEFDATTSSLCQGCRATRADR